MIRTILIAIDMAMMVCTIVIISNDDHDAFHPNQSLFSSFSGRLMMSHSSKTLQIFKS